MKFYSYSVKKLLTDYFGDDTVFAMRAPHETVRKSEDDKNHVLELAWQYADDTMTGYFLEEEYWVDTIIEDDFIVYLSQFQNTPIASIMFMVREDEPDFHIDIEYAKRLITTWEEKGYRVRLARVCVGIEYYGLDKNNGFRLVHHLSSGRGAAFIRLEQVNGNELLVFGDPSCWDHYYKKMLSVVARNDSIEYECLFSDDVEITEGAENNKKTLQQGRNHVIEFFNNNPFSIAYSEFKGTSIYSRIILAGKNEIIISVNRFNLVCEINIGNPIDMGAIIIDQNAENRETLTERIPVLQKVRVLDSTQIHGYGIQLTYGQDNIRNYYLYSFEDRTCPDSVTISGFIFNEKILNSVEADNNGNVVFSNGFIIPQHKLYYHSFHQVTVIHTGAELCSVDGVTFKSIYKLPLKEFHGHFTVRQYRGFKDECFGPKMAWLDKNGYRVSDVAISTSRTSDYKIGAAEVCVEPTGKYGFLNEDGTWLVPPIYDSANPFSTGCAKATRMVDGKETTFLITEQGEEKVFNFPIDADNFYNDRCAFSDMKWEGPYPDAGYYYDYDWVKPGNWGFVNAEGEVVIKPQYVYAAGFYQGGGEHSVVARFVDGKLKWGVIDLMGVETIPCIYNSVYTRWGDAVAFQLNSGDPYGVMDFDGNVIVEPKFDYFEEYNEEHGLITAGEYEDALGVYSISQGCFIIPPEYDSIDYDKHMLSCEVAFTCKERYFDYSGKELDYSEFDSVYEDGKDGDLLKVWKNGKAGVIDREGKIIIPPIMDNGEDFHIDYYNKGLLITGSRKLHGLSRTDGTILIPERYTDISLHGELAICSNRTDANWCIRDTIFSVDGTEVLKGLYRNVVINGDQYRMTAETPTGVELFEIITERSIK